MFGQIDPMNADDLQCFYPRSSFIGAPTGSRWKDYEMRKGVRENKGDEPRREAKTT